MSATTISLHKGVRAHAGPSRRHREIRVASVEEIREVMTPGSGYALPLRPRGAGSAATDCNASTVGTVLDLTALDDIVDIDTYNHRVTVQAGARISQVVDALAVHGMELEGSHDLVHRSVGGAVAGGCIGPGIGNDAALFASQLLGLKAITPEGKLLVADIGQQKILSVLRLSYGMLGTVFEVTLRARPVMAFSATHRRCSIEQFSNAVEKLARAAVGLKFFLLPFRDRVYLDLRRFDAQANATASLRWKIKDWGESTVLPSVFKSLNRVIPVSGVRYRLMDQVSSITQGLVSNRLVTGGSTATAKSGLQNHPSMRYSTWLFPACDFTVVVRAWREFCERVRAESGFRCDMPTVGYLVGQDRSAVLSPSFDEPMVALSAVSTDDRGWDDFAIDFGEFARNWGGVPVFNQSLEVDPGYARTVFGRRLDYFRKVRRQVDPDNRMMNPYLSQYFL